MIKTEQQIKDMEKAVEITDEIFTKVRDFISAGKTEKEVYDFILSEIEKSEADTYSFKPIVASGPNGAEPHHEAGGYVIQDGELVVIDMGVFYNGIASDMTRMVAVGEISDHQWEIYSIVREAMEEAISVIKPGTPISEVDVVARDIIQWYGYADKFIHTTGHGLGTEVHEEPMVFFRTKGLLKEGMVITVEPGIYLEGDLGVRLEQDVLVTSDGHRVLNKSSLDI